MYLAPALPAPEDERGEREETEREQQQEGQEQQEQRLQLQLPFSVLQTYLDAAADEEFYVCRWTRLRGGSGSSGSTGSIGSSSRRRGKKKAKTQAGSGGGITVGEDGSFLASRVGPKEDLNAKKFKPVIGY